MSLKELAPCLICGEPGCEGECWEDDPETWDWKEMEIQKDEDRMERYYEEK